MINSVLATVRIRSGLAETWLINNPILRLGEYGLESDTFLIKIGDGATDWQNLPYLNKYNTDYFKQLNDGALTFSDSFAQTIAALQAAAGQAIENLQIETAPVNDYDVPNKKYVDDAIAASGHMHRQTFQELPSTSQGDPTIIYMIPAANGEGYEEYMFIDGAYDMVGVTSSGNQYELPIANTSRLGGVKASTADNEINVTQTGFMTVNRISGMKLYVDPADTLIINGGTAAG